MNETQTDFSDGERPSSGTLDSESPTNISENATQSDQVLSSSAFVRPELDVSSLLCLTSSDGILKREVSDSIEKWLDWKASLSPEDASAYIEQLKREFDSEHAQLEAKYLSTNLTL